MVDDSAPRWAVTDSPVGPEPDFRSRLLARRAEEALARLIFAAQVAQLPKPGDRRSGLDRRSGADRRSDPARRGSGRRAGDGLP